MKISTLLLLAIVGLTFVQSLCNTIKTTAKTTSSKLFIIISFDLKHNFIAILFTFPENPYFEERLCSSVVAGEGSGQRPSFLDGAKKEGVPKGSQNNIFGALSHFLLRKYQFLALKRLK